MSVTSISNFDISTLSPEISFVVDTNVLYFVHSGYHSGDAKSNDYSNLIQSIISSGHKIKVSTLTVQEFLYIIENKEYRDYCNKNKKNTKQYTKKDFRRDTAERNNIKAKFKTILLELGIYEFEDSKVDSDMINRFVDESDSHTMDPVDYILINNCDIAKTIFISDDKDFQSVSSINVLTA